MKDQSTLKVDSPSEKWDRGRSLLLESLYKPDPALRNCSHNQNCYDEMLSIRDEVIEYVRGLSNPYDSKPLTKWR